MLLNGLYTNASIFSNTTVEISAIDQIQNIIDQPFMKNVKVRIMPDVHAGAGICIGYTATLNDYVVPNFVGVDIGCGLSCLPIPKECAVNFEKLDLNIRQRIPYGYRIHNKIDWETLEFVFKEMTSNDCFGAFCKAIKGISKKISKGSDQIFQAIGSLGGGNHFISVDKDFESNYFLVIHSGSRNFGKRIADYHQDIANNKQQVKCIVCIHHEFKDKHGKESDHHHWCKKYNKNCHASKKTCDQRTGWGFLTDNSKDEYLNDMLIAQKYAALNRRMVLTRLARFIGFEYAENNIIESIHNYIDFNDSILRKGAVSAHEKEKVLIPLSMADGILYCEGKGNPEWNFSAPHGAGRLMSRTQAKKDFTIEEYEKRMKESGVWSSCISQGTLDESPMVYKSPNHIKSIIGDTVNIIDHWKEVYNFKASE